MNVLAVVITPPVYKASGGVAAGLALTRSTVGKVASISAVIMAEQDFAREDGGLTVRGLACTNRLGPLRGAIPRRFATPFWRSDIPAYIRRTRPDIVHLHNPMPPLALHDVARACRALDIPYVISSHGFVEMTGYAAAYGIGGPGRHLLEPIVTRPFVRAVRGAARVCMLSPLEAPILDELGVSAERRAVVTNGATRFFTEAATAEELASVRSRFLRTDRPTVLYVGNHTRNKGLDVLLHALQRVETPVHVVIAGAIRSPEEHEALVRAWPIDAELHSVVYTDAISDTDLRALYQSADLFVFPSRADTLPLVVIEAMVSGLPVISTRVGGIPYQVTDETGILVESEDWEALATAIDALARSPESRQRLGMAARARALSLFNWDRAAEDAVRVYEDVLSGTLERR